MKERKNTQNATHDLNLHLNQQSDRSGNADLYKVERSPNCTE